MLAEEVLGSALVVRLLVVLESVAVLILAGVVLAVTTAVVASVGLVTVGSVVAFTDVKSVDFNDVTVFTDAEPEVAVLLSANKTKS